MVIQIGAVLSTASDEYFIPFGYYAAMQHIQAKFTVMHTLAFERDNGKLRAI